MVQATRSYRRSPSTMAIDLPQRPYSDPGPSLQFLSVPHRIMRIAIALPYWHEEPLL